MLPIGCYEINQLAANLEHCANTADLYGLFDAIEKICKVQKTALRSTIVLNHPRTPVLYGFRYALHLLRHPNHSTVKYSKVCEDLETLVSESEFAAIKTRHTLTTDQLTIRPVEKL